MFGYSCPYCGRGVVRATTFRNHKTRIYGKPVTVPKAVIGVCDRCGGRTYSAREFKRWIKIDKIRRRT